jgi:4-aminobutyrate aminotransferase-like enzyme
MERDRVLENVARLERLAQSRLEPLVSKYEIVGDVRIQGLFIALEFVQDQRTRRPAATPAREIHQGCVRRGLVPVHEDGLWWLRLYPALNMPQSTFESGLDILEEAIDEVARRH